MKKAGERKPRVSKRKTQPDAGYPHYPVKDDIYSRDLETELNPENILEIKKRDEITGEDELNEKNFGEVVTGSDLDIPGSELDDVQEDIGSEDEENNYYSIGGDNRENLEEDKGG